MLRFSVIVLGGLLLASFAANPARAQLLDQLKGAVGSGQGGGSSGLGGGVLGGGMPSLGSATPSNIGGLLQYCVQNNYLDGGSVGSVKGSLMSRLNGSGQGTTDPRYQAGSRGLLESGGGQNYSLGGSGIKQQVTKQICDQVLQHAKSLI